MLRALALLCLLPLAAGAEPLTLEILYNTSESHQNIAVAIGQMWKQTLGIETTLANQEWQTFLDARKNIPDFSRELCERLEVAYRDPVAIDTAKIEGVLAGLGQVRAWKEPVRKGRRVYDDAEFFNSVAAQFTAKKSLSEAQLKVLERMFLRYRDQIPGADETIARFAITLPPRKPRAAAANA